MVLRVVTPLGEGTLIGVCSWTLLVGPSSSGQSHYLFLREVFSSRQALKAVFENQQHFIMNPFGVE